MSTLGERIKERRKAIGLTQEDLAGDNLSSGMISLIERNLTNPSLKTLEQLAKKLGVSVNFLLNQVETNKTDLENKQITLRMLKGLIKARKLSEAEKMINGLEDGEIDYSLEGLFYKLKGDLYLAKKEYTNAIQAFEETLVFLNPFELNEYVDVYYNLADSYVQVKEYQLAIEMVLKGLLLMQSTHVNTDILLKLKLLYLQSYSYCRINEFNKGLTVINEAMGFMKENNCYYNEGLFYMLSGLAYLYLKQFDKGIECNEKALTLIDIEDCKEQFIGCSTNLGILYRNMGDYGKSIHYLEYSLRLSLDNNLQWSITNNYFELAYTLYMKKDLNKAQEICETQVLSIGELNPLKIKMILLLAYIKFDQELYGEALIYTNDVKGKAEKLNDQNLIAKACILKSKILHQQNSYIEAFEQLLHSVRIYEEGMENNYDAFLT
ncbi:helix-turn-helix transcriptional regulator [Niallia taxi]|uniref:helix-turn-helix domain-containing protein n=1 Tax=Niallia taxi TaxID=2499688 RepID=UPI00203A8582|nr:helix-turn-helix transcriptional regulator [Niallia taxi]MCM3216670.1 helix-turn-helix domain-containing protein [Niallia taxi]